jgi:hypothetical protein
MLVDSDDLTRLPPERLDLLSLLTPILSPGGRALDLLQRDMPELYHVPAQGAAGQWHLVGLFNWGDCPANKRVSLAQLGFPPGQPVYIFDFWGQRLWQTVERVLVFPEIPAHGCRLLRLCSGDTPAPVLLGDTLHITQGLEIAEWITEPGRLTIHTLDLGRTACGSLWLRLSAEPGIIICNGELLVASLVKEDVYRVEISRKP